MRMSEPKKTTFTPPPNPSAPGTPEWFYNEIMRHVEPDLLTTAIPQHAEYYGSETKEQRIKRMDSYDKAFAIYDKVAAQAEDKFTADLHALRDKAHQDTLRKERREQERGVEDVESKLDQA